MDFNSQKELITNEFLLPTLLSMRQSYSKGYVLTYKCNRGNMALELQLSLHNVKTHIGFNTAIFKTPLSLLGVLP